MKGLELPMSTLVVIIVALVILIAIISLFYNIWPKGAETVSLETAKNSACQLLSSTGCTLRPDQIFINNFDADKDGVVGTVDPSEVGYDFDITDCGDTANPAATDDNLRMLCACYYNIGDEDECKTKVCNCPS